MTSYGWGMVKWHLMVGEWVASYGWGMVKCHLMDGEWLSGILWLGNG